MGGRFTVGPQWASTTAGTGELRIALPGFDVDVISVVLSCTSRVARGYRAHCNSTSPVAVSPSDFALSVARETTFRDLTATGTATLLTLAVDTTMADSAGFAITVNFAASWGGQTPVAASQNIVVVDVNSTASGCALFLSVGRTFVTLSCTVVLQTDRFGVSATAMEDDFKLNATAGNFTATAPALSGAKYSRNVTCAYVSRSRVDFFWSSSRGEALQLPAAAPFSKSIQIPVISLTCTTTTFSLNINITLLPTAVCTLAMVDVMEAVSLSHLLAPRVTPSTALSLTPLAAVSGQTSFTFSANVTNRTETAFTITVPFSLSRVSFVDGSLVPAASVEGSFVGAYSYPRPFELRTSLDFAIAPQR
eukprot:tig00020964_g16809.t1